METLADQDGIDAFEAMLKTKYACKKLANLGFTEGDDRVATFLNLVVTVEMQEQPYKLVCEPDARHARILIQELGLERATGAETPADHR